MEDYRGGRYHTTQSTSTQQPNATQKAYFLWSGGVARTAAIAVSDPSGLVEIVYDRPWASSGAAENLAGRAYVYVNGSPAPDPFTSFDWILTTSDQGMATITVPAGNFNTTRWDGSMSQGKITDVYSAYDKDQARIRTDGSVFREGILTRTYMSELTGGPVGPAAAAVGRINLRGAIVHAQVREILSRHRKVGP